MQLGGNVGGMSAIVRAFSGHDQTKGVFNKQIDFACVTEGCDGLASASGIRGASLRFRGRSSVVKKVGGASAVMRALFAWNGGAERLFVNEIERICVKSDLDGLTDANVSHGGSGGELVRCRGLSGVAMATSFAPGNARLASDTFVGVHFHRGDGFCCASLLWPKEPLGQSNWPL